MIKTIKTMSKQEKERYTVPRKVQDVIPVRRIWPDGIFFDRQPLLQNLPLFGHQLPGSQPGGQGIHVPHLLGAAQFPGLRRGDENHHQQPPLEQGKL